MSGVKQGCNLSPTLSNLFQNDLHDLFDNTCDPVLLEEFEINSLSWADDLVLFSSTKIGLQKCLDNLAAYCHMWQLEVNVDKTKVMVMSAGRTAARDITFQGQELQCVNSYKYLGLMISSDGSIRKMIEERVTKAKRASFVLRQALSTSQNVSVNLYMSLFDKQIEPILLYGCPLWGMPSSNCTIKIRGG